MRAENPALIGAGWLHWTGGLGGLHDCQEGSEGQVPQKDGIAGARHRPRQSL
jgi:hypothetical protein